MQMNTGGGNRALHYSDLNSPNNVSSAEMPKDNGRGHVALRYSHESDDSAEIQMDSGGGNICYPKEGDTFLDPAVEMQMNTGGGNRALHYSDLNSPSNVSSAEMPKDNGRGHVALRYSHLYSHESDHSAEIQMDRGSGNICDPKEGDTFLDPAAEYTESNSESESSSREDSVCDAQEQIIQSNQDQPEDLSLVRHSSCFTAVQDHSLVQDSYRNPPLPSRSCRSQGPIVLLGRSSYFTSLYKQVHTLTAIAERYHYDLSFIKAEVDAIKRWDILQKNQLEYIKTELEIMLGDKNVEPDLQSDLTDTDEEEERGRKDGNETDGNSSSSSSIREVVYDENACEKYIKPQQVPPISAILTNPPQRLPNQPNIIQNSKLACDKSTTGTSRICQYEESSAAALPQWPQQGPRFGSPATFQQRCGVVTTSETIQNLASSSTWKFNPPPSHAPEHHIGSMVIDVPEQNRQIKLDVHKTTVGQIVSSSHYNCLRNFVCIFIFPFQFCN